MSDYKSVASVNGKAWASAKRQGDKAMRELVEGAARAIVFKAIAEGFDKPIKKIGIQIVPNWDEEDGDILVEVHISFKEKEKSE